ncbi:ABC-transporter-regulating transcription factor like protein [Verticillium longisporum]|nr:ABC-transporter-regulating transcription factor like protein [Verticillium longisporum]
MSASNQQAERAQRTQQACKRCRSRKSRCDAGRPSCSSCLSQGHECVYDVAPRRRGPGRNKEYVRALEERLSKMESTLQHAGISQPETAPSPSTADTQPATNVTGLAPDVPDSQVPSNPKSTPADAAELGQETEVLFPDLGVMSELHARMPLVGAIRRWMSTPQPKFTGPTFVRRCYTAGLQRHEAITLWLPLVDHVTETFPALNLADFLPRYGGLSATDGRSGADELFESAAGWAYANACIALGASLKCLNESCFLMHRPIWSFFMNAFEALPELLARGDDAIAVNAIVAMAIWMQGTLFTSLAISLASSASAMSIRLGFQRGACSKLTGEGSRIQDCVFWSTYILDKSMSILHGVPPMISDDDIEIDLPETRGTDVPWFRLRAQLARIEAQVSRRLYTAKSLKLDGGQIFQTILDCEVLLDGWKSSLPGTLDDDIVDGISDADSLQGDKLDVFLVFNNCLLLTHWALRHSSEDGPIALRVERTQSHLDPILHVDVPRSRHCLLRSRSAAQAVIRIYCTYREPPFTFLWRNLAYPLCAVLVLITDILDEPATAQAIKLLQATRSFSRFLQRFEREERCSLNQVLRSCATLQRTAQLAVQEAHEGSVVESPLVITPGTPRSTPREDAETLHSILRSATNPMYLAQGLLGNQPNRDQALYTKLAELLGCPAHENPTGIPLGSEVLWPPTYGLSLAPDAR